MFSVYHIIWLLICSVIVICSLYLIKRTDFSFSSVVNCCMLVSLLSECVKVFSVVKMLPLSDGKGFVPYLELNHLPLHLCSIQILFILFLRFSPDNSPLKRRLLGFMYPSCILGAAAALLMPSIYTTTIRPDQSFTHPMAYQFFIFHSMLIILGISIYREFRSSLTKQDYLNSIIIIVSLAVLFIYLNSVFSVPLYEGGEVISIENYTNFFFTYNPPVPVRLTETWHWALYLVILTAVAISLLTILYIPVLRRSKKDR